MRAQILARQGDLAGAARELGDYIASGPPPDEARELADDLAALGVSGADVLSTPPGPPGS